VTVPQPPSAEVLSLLLADARLPVAGHTQSGSLEAAVRDGLTDVPAFLNGRLTTVTRIEAGTAVVALHHLRQGLALGSVEQAWAARTPSRPLRSTSRLQARALLRLAVRLWPDAPALRTVAGLGSPSRAVALAAVASVGVLAPVQLARVTAYDDVQTVAAAALKLLPLDPAEVTAWVLDVLPTVDALAADVAPLSSPDAIPAVGSPQIEAWAQSHAVSTRRLFSA